MPQPDFRKRLTAHIENLPTPIARCWRPIDPFHRRIEAKIDRIEKAHFGFRDSIVLPLAARLGASATTVEGLQNAHTRIVGRTFAWLRAAHWYV